jgi:aspartyl-tRNA(Asn)/glutamyl-tRNA(Gln) amidotransferase subunit A
MSAARIKMGHPKDPLGGVSVEEFARRLRRGELTIEATVRGYLARIDALDPRLGAFELARSSSLLQIRR